MTTLLSYLHNSITAHDQTQSVPHQLGDAGAAVMTPPGGPA